jgi:integrase
LAGADLLAELEAHRERQLAERRVGGSAWEQSGYVFVDELGAPLSPRALSHRFARLVKEAGLRPIRLHDCRHSAATLLLGMGTPVHEVSRLLGHSRPSITLDIYAHAMPGVGERAGADLTRLLAENAQDVDKVLTLGTAS